MSTSHATWPSLSRLSRAEMSRLLSITLRASGIARRRTTAADSTRDARAASQYTLRASGIARRRTEKERAEAFFPLRATTTAAGSERDARAASQYSA
jgi:hypothetical protein